MKNDSIIVHQTYSIIDSLADIQAVSMNWPAGWEAAYVNPAKAEGVKKFIPIMKVEYNINIDVS